MTTDVAVQELSRNLRRRGTLILAVFALLWAAAGASGLAGAGAAQLVVGVVAVLVTVAAIVLGVRSGSRPPPPRQLPDGWLRQVGRVNVGQFAAIAIAVVVLLVAGVPLLVPAAVCLIVGVHFLPLARLFDQWQYRWTGVLLCAAAVAGIVVFASGGSVLSRAVVGLGAAVVLWATSLHVAIRG